MREFLIRSTLCAGLVACARSEPDASEEVVQPEMILSATPTANAITATVGPSFVSEGSINPRLLVRFQALKNEGFDATANAAAVELGHRLFFDPRLSSGDDISCSSCHDVAHGGVDTKAKSAGAKGHLGERNTPTVLNAAGAFAQFWDGRAASVEEQALIPISSPTEMGGQSGAAVVQRLKAIPEYRQRFESAFPADRDPVTFRNIGIAIGSYERRLSTPGRWDRFLDGDRSALSSREKEGLRTFLSVGCMVCHTGPLVGGSSFAKLGAVIAWPNQADTGRMRVTSDVRDRMMFKVPTLRNVSRTAPYFHDGSAATLDDAVKAMGHHQLGIELTAREVQSIVSWLRALDGDVDPALAAAPDP